MRTMRTRWGCCLAVVLAFAACGGDGDGSSPATVPDTRAGVSESSTSDPTSTTSRADVEAEIEAAFFAQWDAFIEILGDPDPDDPLIDRHFTGRAKAKVLESVQEFLAEGLVARLPDDPADFAPSIQRIERIDESTYLVVECTIDGVQVVETETGSVIDGDVVIDFFENEFVRGADGNWRLRLSVVAEGSPPCGP